MNIKITKKRYFNKAVAIFQVLKTYRLTKEDVDKADGMTGSLGAKASDFKILVNIAKDTLAGRYKMNKLNLAIITATIIYVISPLDAIPDMIPVLGWIDDVSIVAYAVGKLHDEILRDKAFALKNDVDINTVKKVR